MSVRWTRKSNFLFLKTMVVFSNIWQHCCLVLTWMVNSPGTLLAPRNFGLNVHAFYLSNGSSLLTSVATNTKVASTTQWRLSSAWKEVDLYFNDKATLTSLSPYSLSLGVRITSKYLNYSLPSWQSVWRLRIIYIIYKYRICNFWLFVLSVIKFINRCCVRFKDDQFVCDTDYYTSIDVVVTS